MSSPVVLIAGVFSGIGRATAAGLARTGAKVVASGRHNDAGASLAAELRAVQAPGSGSIVNVSSTFGHADSTGASTYVASEHAVEGLTKSAALEVVSLGIPVNAAAPDAIRTSMVDRFTGSEEVKAHLAALNTQKRNGRPDEITRANLCIETRPALSPATSFALRAECPPAGQKGHTTKPAFPSFPSHESPHRVVQQSETLRIERLT